MQSVGRAIPPRRDPAPSRWAYRMQRMWLTPLFRVLLRFGLPVVLIGLLVGAYAADAGRRAALGAAFADLRDRFQDRPEFLVSLVSIEGASPELSKAVRAHLGLKLPQSSFDLDLDVAREKAEALDAVASADLRIRTGGVLQVVIIEREPVVIWRTVDGLTMLDATGHRVAGLAARADRPDLPLIAGEGADAAAVEALEILEAAQPLAQRIRGLIRISAHRWDIVLDRNQRLMLPAENPIAAVERLLALDQAEDLLARDIIAVDLRIAARPVLRLAPDALTELRRASGQTPVVESDL
ncbi:MAG: cell division protein FtsQ/DivIB [Paracoccaceae bacterium]